MSNETPGRFSINPPDNEIEMAEVTGKEPLKGTDAQLQSKAQKRQYEHVVIPNFYGSEFITN